MKKYYKLLFCWLVVVAIVFSSNVGIYLESLSPVAQGFAMLFFLIPMCLSLYLISKDETKKSWVRKTAKITIAFFVFCYVAGFLAELS